MNASAKRTYKCVEFQTRSGKKVAFRARVKGKSRERRREMFFLQDSRLFGALRMFFGKLKVVRPLVERRSERISKLESIATSEEEKNKELEAHLEFKRREHEALGKIQAARTRRERLQGQLGEYGVRRPRLLRWGLIGGGVILVLVWLIKC